MKVQLNFGKRTDGSFEESYWIRIDDRFGSEAVKQIEESWTEQINTFASARISMDKRAEGLAALEGDIGLMIMRTYLDAAELLAQEAGNPGKALERIDVIRLAFERAIAPDGVAGDDISRKLASNGFERLLVGELAFCGVPGFEPGSITVDVEDPLLQEDDDPDRGVPTYA